MTPTIDLEHDELIPVGELVRRRLGKRLSPATLWRWRLKGVGGVRLEAVRVGGVWCTTPAAFADFIRRQTAAALSRHDEGDVERSDVTQRRLTAAGLA